MKLTLGFSPCPNDTFIFDALIHHKIDTEGLEFEVVFDDVETLNQKALKGELDITKLSFHAFAYATDKYALLDAGSALGFGVGPLLISKKYTIDSLQLTVENSQALNSSSQTLSASSELPVDDEQSHHSSLKTHHSNLKIGIPGKYTTANFLLGIAYPQLQNKEVLVFSGIESALLEDKIDLGLIIHENRFTYQDKGLNKIIDLGDYWEKLTGCAIPLGGIVINRKLAHEVQLKVNRLIRKSVEYAFENPKSSLEFIRKHAQEMDEAVMYKHIELYVNKYSINLGNEGRKAIDTLFKLATERNIIPPIQNNLYVTE
ncbi:1,4-dihydroxy-6-naphthoate synthase [Pedobacter changchengzhani]|uniref:1,4-dihydroxy-6-naphtoate synthase n=1 Tax=Pedobacter changchengzhani TaxID=2529274 RepID=A0A4V3A0F3_9SPHI|nr:1,4-dihydroxy-6-naphthoate synthase [Pedobacter changchengzhani]TDG37363.1 1,4-dihydroxy-6-naphthoate synthase [Pedobacter changchengzhani]